MAPRDRDRPPELQRNPDPEMSEADALPVVARLVIEIRSDGRRTIARGAMETVSDEGGAPTQRTAIEAHGNSPLSLALAITRSLATLPALALRAARDRSASQRTQPEPPRRSLRSRLRGLLPGQRR